MSSILLIPASKPVAKRTLAAAGVTFVASGAFSIHGITGALEKMLGNGQLNEPYLHMAVAFSFVLGMLGAFVGKVLTIGLAQLGVATAIMLIACSISPAVVPGYFGVYRGVLAMIAVVLLAVFAQSLKFVLRQGTPLDFYIGLVLYVFFAAMWVYCVLFPKG